MLIEEYFKSENNEIQAGAELGQAHVMLEVSVELEFELGVEVVIKIRSYVIGLSWSFTTFPVGSLGGQSCKKSCFLPIWS